AAFRAGDSARAFSYASAQLQAQFGDAATFMAMVRRDYAPVFAARSVTARDLVLYHGYVTQRSVLVGADGLPFVALYLMSRRPDGSWAISGCILLKGEEQVS